MAGFLGMSALLRRDLVARLAPLLDDDGPPLGLSEAEQVAVRTGRVDALSLDTLAEALARAGHPVRAQDLQPASAAVSYRDLLQSLTEGFGVIEMIFDADGAVADYRFIETNPAFEAHTGLSDVVGRTVLEVVPDIEPRWIETYGRVAQTGEPTRFQQPAGALGRTYRVQAFPMGDAADHRVAILFSDITDRLQSEAALRRANETLEEEVETRTREVRALARALTMAEQEVRRRIAHVLHDDLQQVLHGAQIAAQVQDADRLEGLLDRALSLTRLLAYELSPPLLSDTGLGPLMTWLADNQGALYGLTVSVDVPDTVVVYEEHLRILLYQLVRELLFNVAKHARTRTARIRAEADAEVVRIVVEDDGVGFTPPSLTELQEGRGAGLSSVWDRLTLVGGRLDIASAPGAGTRLMLEVPSEAPRP